MINPSRDPDEELVQQYLLSKKELFEGLKKLQHRHSHHDATLASTSTFSYLQEALELLKKEPMGQRMVLSNYDHALWYRSAELHLITRTLSRVLISQGIMLLYDSLPKDSNEGFASSPQERKAAGTHMQQLIRDAASVGMPQQLRTEALANATSSLCRFWVTRKYGAYDRIESGSHQSQSPMALIKAEVLSTFCPIADHFAQLAREPGQKVSTSTSTNTICELHKALVVPCLLTSQHVARALRTKFVTIRDGCPDYHAPSPTGRQC